MGMKMARLTLPPARLPGLLLVIAAIAVLAMLLATPVHSLNAEDETQTFSLATSNTDPRGICHAADTMYVLEQADKKIYAYSYQTTTPICTPSDSQAPSGQPESRDPVTARGPKPLEHAQGLQRGPLFSYSPKTNRTAHST